MQEHLLRAADYNYFGATALFAACSLRGEVLENHDAVICNSGFALPSYNLAFVKPEARSVSDALEYGCEHFARTRVPHQFRIPEGLEREVAPRLCVRGYRPRHIVPGMLWCHSTPVPGPRDDLEVRTVRGHRELDAFRRVAFQGFGHNPSAARLFLTEQLIAHPNVEAYIGYACGRPVCTSMLVLGAGVAGIYWVATLDAERRRGFGEAITWAAVRRGLELGLDAVGLQASQMGRPLYQRMGFELSSYYLSYESPGLGA